MCEILKDMLLCKVGTVDREKLMNDEVCIWLPLEEILKLSYNKFLVFQKDNG